MTSRIGWLMDKQKFSLQFSANKKINFLVIALLASVAVAGIVLMIPSVQSLIINLAERVLHRTLRDHSKWQRMMTKGGVMLLIAVTVSYFLNKKISFVERTKKQIKYIKENLVFCDIKVYIKPFLILFALYFLSFSSIIRSNFNYIDDLARVVYGYRGWENFSRYLSNFISQFIHGGKFLSDVSPFTQYIAILILSASGMCLAKIFSDGKEISYISLISTLLLGLSPYFLECISYKYDSPYMALSIFAGIFPFCFYDKASTTIRDYIAYIVVSAIGIIVVCTTYQAASGIYPMIAVAICLREWNSGVSTKKVLRFLIISAVAYIIGLCIFRFFIMQKVDSYVSNSLPPFKEILPATIQNLKSYFSLVTNDFSKLWKILALINIIIFIFVNVLNSGRNKIFSVSVTVIGLLIILSLMFGLYPFLEKPLFAPRAMYGLGVFLAIICQYNLVFTKGIYTSRAKIIHLLAKIFSISLCWVFFSFAFVYGNALAEQKRWTDFRVNLVINDLNEIASSGNEIVIELNGDIGKSPVFLGDEKRNPVLRRLVPVTFGGSGWTWNQAYFFTHFGLKNVKQNASYNDNYINLREMNLPILKNTMYHTIYGDEDYILIELK